MNNRDPVHRADADDLYVIACAYQDVLRRGANAPADQHSYWSHEAHVPMQQLYAVLAGSLHGIVRRWTNSMLFQETRATRSYHEAVETLAYSCIGTIGAAIMKPSCNIDPDKNVRAYLLKIASNDLYNQEQKIYKAEPRQRRDLTLLQSGDAAAAMWGDPPRDADSAAEHADPISTDFEDRVLSRDILRIYWPLVTTFWQDTLSPADIQIMRARWLVDPPVSFASIAQQHGAGWTMVAVKQRHHRILQRTRDYLIAQGLLDSTS